uniref:Uncharacterized protein n=1 Tax=Anguilla anguilla TaxID=7936 RepID=A0A0E9TZV6_ANGAN
MDTIFLDPKTSISVAIVSHHNICLHSVIISEIISYEDETT